MKDKSLEKYPVKVKREKRQVIQTECAKTICDKIKLLHTCVILISE